MIDEQGARRAPFSFASRPIGLGTMRLSLEATRDALRDGKFDITLPEEIRAGAERALRRMFELTA